MAHRWTNTLTHADVTPRAASFMLVRARAREASRAVTMLLATHARKPAELAGKWAKAADEGMERRPLTLEESQDNLMAFAAMHGAPKHVLKGMRKAKVLRMVMRRKPSNG